MYIGGRPIVGIVRLRNQSGERKCNKSTLYCDFKNLVMRIVVSIINACFIKELC